MILLKIIKKESANLICGFRFFGSFWLIFFSPSILFSAVFYTILFISDALDGYLYRKYVKNDPPKHWFNKLPITMDPIADITLAIAGFIHIGNYLGDFKTLLVINVVAVFIGLICNVILLVSKETETSWKITKTFITYAWFLYMLVAMVWLWALAIKPADAKGFIIATIIFQIYYFLLIVNKKSR